MKDFAINGIMVGQQFDLPVTDTRAGLDLYTYHVEVIDVNREAKEIKLKILRITRTVTEDV